MNRFGPQFLNILLPVAFISAFAFGMRLEGVASIALFVCVVGILCFVFGFFRKIRQGIQTSVDTNSLPFVASGIIALFVLPFFQLSVPYVIYVETSIFVLCITLLAFSITLGLAGMVDLGIGAYIGVGAYVSARVSMDIGLPVIITPLVAAIASGILAKVLSLLILKARGHYFSLVTLGLGLVFFHLFIQASPLTAGTDGIGNIPGISILGITTDHYLQLGSLMFPYQLISYFWGLVCFLFVFFLVVRIRSGQFGRCLQAARYNETAAIGSGVHVFHHRSWAYTLAGTIAGFSGALYTHTVNYIAPEVFGLHASVFYLVLSVMGGLGKPIPSVVIAFGIILIQEKLQDVGDFRMLLVAMFILGITLYRARVSGRQSVFSGGV